MGRAAGTHLFSSCPAALTQPVVGSIVSERKGSNITETVVIVYLWYIATALAIGKTADALRLPLPCPTLLAVTGAQCL